MGDGLIDPEPSRARRLADAAWAHRADSAAVCAEAAAAYRVSIRAGDLAAAAIADRATAVAMFELGDAPGGMRRARRAVRHAMASGDTDVLAGSLITLGGGLSLSGQSVEALSALDAACGHASGSVLIDARAQRAVALNSAGRRGEALGELELLLDARAIAQPNALQRAELLHDRGVVLALLGRFDQAGDSFGTAAKYFDELGHRNAAFDARRNLALVHVQAGELSAALRLFATLETEASGDCQQLVWLGCVQMEALISANLRQEATDVADRLIETATAASPDLRAEAWRLCAEAFAMTGDIARSAAVAKRAEPLFRRRGFVPFAAVTRRLWAAGLSARRRVTLLTEVIDELTAAGLRSETVTTRVARLKAAVEAGNDTIVATDRHALAAVRRSRNPVLVQVQCWLGEAVALIALGDLCAAGLAARNGLQLLDQHRASIGATELRAHASGLGEELAAIGMRAAFATGRAIEVFGATERWRASTLFATSASSPELNAALGDLRALLANSDEVLGGEMDAAAVDRRRQRAEDQVRLLARGLEATSVAAESVPTQRRLRHALGQRWLVEIVEHGDRYHAAVFMPSGPPRLIELAPIASVRHATDELAFGLRRLARAGISLAGATAAMRTASDALADLDQLLVAPLGRLPSSVVLVPPVSLLAVPFPALGSMVTCDVTVAPSARWWCAMSETAASSPSPGHRKPMTLIAGPGLPGAADEVNRLAAIARQAAVLTGTEATTSAAMAVLDGCDLAHLACHGRLRADHPHLSSLTMFDGPLTIYDFERLSAAPRRVVLAACDSATGAVRAGDELLGFLTALLSLGTHDVLASVVPVPDLATAEFMVRFHEHCGAGASFSSALRHARASLDLSVPANFAAATAFVAFGIGNLSA
jgi:tetratricopeptide (TPR) repeat protein